MKEYAFEQLPAELAVLLEELQRQRVLITRGGEPFAVVASAGNKDEEDLDLEDSPEFWRMIEERRRETATITLAEFVAELDKEERQNSDGKGSDKTLKETARDGATDVINP
jgi:PHD/YefM family antitoxin component YafN of YafNO toxin-antitoxin module